MKLSSLILVILFLSSCGTISNKLVVKRVYSKGYYVGKSTYDKRYKIQEDIVPSILKVEEPETETIYASASRELCLTKIKPVLQKTAVCPNDKKNSTKNLVNEIPNSLPIKNAEHHTSIKKTHWGDNGALNGAAFGFVFILFTILYTLTIMHRSPGVGFFAALAFGALFAFLTALTGIYFM